ncbi:PREDICTED: myb-like protein F, partial [Diuraphis noxia]|uniref:myb-like protein F n=1 Tax=Diuraphis noxia TaxID=143948 RepID=UPI0007636D8D
DKEFIDDSSVCRSDLSKDKYDESNDNKEINNKYLPSRLQKQFEQNNDVSNKAQNVSSTKSINTLCRTDSDMSSSGYSEYRSDSWVEDDHTNKSSTLKRDKRTEFDRYRREKVRSDSKDKNDKYAHSDYTSRGDDNRKNYDHRRDFKRNDSGGNLKKSIDDNYDVDKKEFTKVSKYHSRDSLETPEDIEKDNVQVDDEYHWRQNSLGKDFYKDEINSSGQYGKKYIPGPITQEKLGACELTSEPKRNLNQLVKSERKDMKKNDQ